MNPALTTDLYQLTMAQALYEAEDDSTATFSMYIREMPNCRSYYVFGGLESALAYLQTFRFTKEDVSQLDSLGIFSQEFLNYLLTFRFQADVWAMREGELFFQMEPVLEITGSLLECQLVETFLLNQLGAETLFMTKASRVVYAANGKPVLDFATRRTHGAEAALKHARAAYLAGFEGTSNVAAAVLYGIPAIGTMAHSFILAFEDESKAFAQYSQTFPETSSFLVDTYNTPNGIIRAIDVGLWLQTKGHQLQALRLDSGDLAGLAAYARERLDQAGLHATQIIASGGLDEYTIQELENKGTQIDCYGVGTKVGSSADRPYTDFVYKMTEHNELPVMKLSEGKVSLPYRKQVYRNMLRADLMNADYIGRREEDPAAVQKNFVRQGFIISSGVEALLQPVMTKGVRLAPKRSIQEIREFHLQRVKARGQHALS